MTDDEAIARAEERLAFADRALLTLAKSAASLRAELAAAREWRPIESAPDLVKASGVDVLLCIECKPYARDIFFKLVVGKWVSFDYGSRGRWHYEEPFSGYGDHAPTHWRPLPAPPSEATPRKDC
jgi:hypothetical protein